jgi:hypothetical protein
VRAGQRAAPTLLRTHPQRMRQDLAPRPRTAPAPARGRGTGLRQTQSAPAPDHTSAASASALRQSECMFRGLVFRNSMLGMPLQGYLSGLHSLFSRDHHGKASVSASGLKEGVGFNPRVNFDGERKVSPSAGSPIPEDHSATATTPASVSTTPLRRRRPLRPSATVSTDDRSG